MLTLHGTPGPPITVIGGEGGLLATPVILDPSLVDPLADPDVDPNIYQTLLMGPGQRYDVVIDFTGFAPGTRFTLMNDAGAPYPSGDPVVAETTGKIMQFVVNGAMVSAAVPTLPGKR